ncbi:TetR family transcriptional regulator [Streptomyces antimycoticus]|uniref:TetR family transcriptional regulator n=1 Tax=Streptomyces antimycoticus TaxID=68175 RepID=A0A499UQZ6_9ACTN|nr:TetR/AcrR family transcriptional regulator [Streptomyces antimycoticus]BBJ43492.1 TetR family transcriptional regulator [Streptomyces antimycoticus]
MARTKEFEPEIALRQAMDLFWERGYRETSLGDLVERMGVGRRSLYDTFGDKRTLFVQALVRYAAQQEAAMDEIAALAPDGRQAVRRLFETSVTEGAILRRGCLAVNTATEAASGDPTVSDVVEKHFSHGRRVLFDQVTRGRADGSVSGAGDPASLAGVLFNAWLGLRVRVRAGVSLDSLMADVAATLTLLD